MGGIGGERSYMAMSRAGYQLLDRQYNHKRSSDGGGGGTGPPRSISVFRSSSSFGSFGKLNSLLNLDGLDDSSSGDDDDDDDDNDNVSGPEATQSAPNLFASKHLHNDEHQKIRTQRHSLMDHSNDAKSGVRRARAGQSGGADSQLWHSFARKSGRNLSSAAASGNPYLSFGGQRETATSGGGMPRRRHSDGKLSDLVIREIDMSDDDSDADNEHTKVGGNARGDKSSGRPRTFSGGALDRAVKLGLLDEDDVKEVVNRDDTEIEEMPYEEQLRHYRAVIGEDGHLTDDDYDVGEEFEMDLQDNDRKEHKGHHQRRHSDGALDIFDDNDLEEGVESNRRNVIKVLGEPRKKRGQRLSKTYGSSNRSGSGLQSLKLNKLQALEQGAMRGIGSAVADRDRPPMTITLGGDRPSPSSRWGEDGCKVLANDDETLEAEGEVYASQHRRAARRRSLKDDIPQDEAIKQGPYEMYLLGVERMERRRSNDSGGKLGRMERRRSNDSGWKLGRRSSICSEGKLGGRRGSLQ